MAKIHFLILAMLSGIVPAHSEIAVRTVDFLEVPSLSVNAAGPVLVRMDDARDRLIVANTLSSSLSVIDCGTQSVHNIPLGGRALQHLKSGAMTVRAKTGDIYLIGTRCIHVITPETESSRTVRTDDQFESIAVDEETGNVFVVGRESRSLGFLKNGSKKLALKKWVDRREDLINLNATPPPPIRKVVIDNELGQLIAVDGYTSTLYLFESKNAKQIRSRPLQLAAGGRWHLAGYDESRHSLYLVVETDERRVIQAAKVDVLSGADVVVPLPEHTEGVGITYNAMRDEVYIPYDNHPSVHVVSFEDGELDEIRVPAYGNDAGAVDTVNDLLYIASWAHGEIDVIDLKTRTLRKRIKNLGVIPHMFTMAFNPRNGLLYYPKGASAVNGTFGAAVTSLDPATEETRKIYTGWAPMDLIEMEARNTFLVFNSEDQFAEVHADGTYEIHGLPYDYPIHAIHNLNGDVYLSYGPHQSYWPTVYIWGAKNGVLTIRSDDLSFYDRRIVRQAHRMVLDRDGVSYLTQNNWGKEEQFLGVLTDPVRLFDVNQRLRLEDEVQREITQRILRYDPDLHRLYLIRIGETDDEPSVLQIIDPAEKKVVHRTTVGLTSTDLLFDDQNIYIANFDSESVSIVDKMTFYKTEIPVGKQPLRLCRCAGAVYVINQADNTLQEVRAGGAVHEIPNDGLPDNLFVWQDKPVIVSHNAEKLFITRFDHDTDVFTVLHETTYPYGNVRYDTRNVSFYVGGQFGDAVFDISRAKTDTKGRLWTTDFLAGRLYIIEDR